MSRCAEIREGREVCPKTLCRHNLKQHKEDAVIISQYRTIESTYIIGECSIAADAFIRKCPFKDRVLCVYLYVNQTQLLTSIRCAGQFPILRACSRSYTGFFTVLYTNY